MSASASARPGSARRSPSKASSAWPIGSSRSITRAPSAASTLRASACAQTAPNRPVEAPTTAAGLLRSGDSAIGREIQSSAFLSCPGSERLYSGVATSTASASSIAARSASTASCPAASSSLSYGGIAFNPSYATSSAPGGSRSAAARSSRELCDPDRRLPERPRTFIGLAMNGFERDDELDREWCPGVPGHAASLHDELAVHVRVDGAAIGVAPRTREGDGLGSPGLEVPGVEAVAVVRSGGVNGGGAGGDGHAPAAVYGDGRWLGGGGADRDGGGGRGRGVRP